MKAIRFPGRRARLVRHLTPVMAAVLLSACGTLTPEYQRPPAPVAAAWASPAPSGSAIAAAPAIRWQDFFTDVRLRALVDEFMEDDAVSGKAAGRRASLGGAASGSGDNGGP